MTNSSSGSVKRQFSNFTPPISSVSEFDGRAGSASRSVMVNDGWTYGSANAVGDDPRPWSSMSSAPLTYARPTVPEIAMSPGLSETG